MNKATLPARQDIFRQIEECKTIDSIMFKDTYDRKDGRCYRVKVWPTEEVPFTWEINPRSRFINSGERVFDQEKAKQVINSVEAELKSLNLRGFKLEMSKNVTYDGNVVFRLITDDISKIDTNNCIPLPRKKKVIYNDDFGVLFDEH